MQEVSLVREALSVISENESWTVTSLMSGRGPLRKRAPRSGGVLTGRRALVSTPWCSQYGGMSSFSHANTGSGETVLPA